MYVVISTRVVKVNTGATAQYAPRSTNQTRLTVSGPFESEKTAQKAVLACLSVHTCLDAQVWSLGQVREQIAKGCGTIGNDRMDAMTAAMRCMEALVID